MLRSAGRPVVLLLATFAACDNRAALDDVNDGGAGATAGTRGGGAGTGGGIMHGTGLLDGGAAGTGASAGTYGGYAGTYAAAGTTGYAGTGFIPPFDAGSGVYDAGVGDARPQDAGPPWDGATGNCGALITTPPPGAFKVLSAGNAATCGLRADGTVECWGLREYSTLPVFNGRYKDVSMHGTACAVRVTGDLDCPELGAVAGSFEQVAVMETGFCALRTDLTAFCQYAPPLKFSTLTAGAYYACGLEVGTGRIACWDPRSGAESLKIVDGPFTEVDTGRFWACGLLTDGSIKCWDTTSVWLGSSDAPAGSGYHGLSVGEYHACALRADGQATCWGPQSSPEKVPPAGLIFQSIAPGSEHTCGILLDGTVRCWGRAPFCTG
jgi:hypothetical protein